jgi:hypothetical protein
MLYTGVTMYAIVFLAVMITHVWHVGISTTLHDANYAGLIQRLRSFAVEKRTIYLYDVDPQLYQLSGTIPANRLYVPDYPWYNVLLDQTVLTSIMQSKPNIIVTPLQLTRTKLTDYVNSTYTRVSAVDDAVIWVRK